MARLDRYRIDIPRELSEIRTQPWLSEGSLTCDPYHHMGPIFFFFFFNRKNLFMKEKLNKKET